MKDRDESFWAALTARVDAAQRAGRSEREQLADAERFLQATEDEPLRPELVQEVLDEVTGKREARQVATLPVGANLDRRWQMTRGAAAALIGSVLVLGGYAAMTHLASEHEALHEGRNPMQELEYADAVGMLENVSQGSERRTHAATKILSVFTACVSTLRHASTSPDPMGAEARRLLQRIRGEEPLQNGFALRENSIGEALQKVLDPSAALTVRREALQLVATQAYVALEALASAGRTDELLTSFYSEAKRELRKE